MDIILNNDEQAAPSAFDDSELSEGIEEKSHPIAAAIDVFLHKCEDIKTGVAFIAAASRIRKGRSEKLLKELEEGEALLAREDASSVTGIRKVQKAILHLSHLSKSELPEVLESSLYLGLFSSFDAFTGQLLGAIYKRKPQLYAGLSRTLSVSDILQYKSFEELHDSILREEIEDIRRKSYVEQFKDLESKFGVKLKQFDKWPKFVECAQRRNLITHCDGEISDQYLEVCEKEGFEFGKRPNVGDKLELGPEYFLSACDLLSEVALKLGHTLWRKIFPDEIEDADKELNEAIYDRLEMEEFEQAQVYGDFAREQKNVHSELYKRMFAINLAIALKSTTKLDDANKVLAEMDWSACSQDFKLAEAVLTDKVEIACEILKRIGQKGEMINERSYHVWPLFRTFQTEKKFLQTYEVIYKRPFIAELQKAADKAQISAADSGISTESSNKNIGEEKDVENQVFDKN